MTIDSLYLMRTGGIAAVTGGALRIASSFIPYRPETLWLEIMYAVEDYFLLVGIFAIYLRFASQLGTFGLLTICVITLAVSSIVGPDAEMFGFNFYELGAGVLVIGLAALSVQMLARGLARIESMLWIASFLVAVGAVSFGVNVLVVIAGVLFGLAYIIAGLAVVRSLTPNGQRSYSSKLEANS